MGGVSCKHERKNFRLIGQDGGTSWEKEIVEKKCLDCQKAFITERTILFKTVGYIYSEKTVCKTDCKHESFIVDDTTITTTKEDTLFGSVFRFMGFEADWLQYSFWIADALCNKCGFNFYVRADIPTILGKVEKWTIMEKQPVEKPYE